MALRSLPIVLLILLIVIPVSMAKDSHGNPQLGTQQQQALKVFSKLKSVYIVASDVGLNATDTIGVQNVGDSALKVTVNWRLSPEELQGKIRISTTPSEFIIESGEYMVISVHISVLPGVFVGLYNLSITINWQSVEPQNGNIIIASAVVYTSILVGEHSYKLEVILRQPDGSPASGMIKVSYYFRDRYVPIYQIYATHYTFYVIEGKYLVEAYLGGMKRASQEVDVVNDVIISLTFSPIYISRFEIISKPMMVKDSLVFFTELKNDDPLVYRKVVSLTVSMYRGTELIVNNKSIATLTIRSNVIKDVLGFVEPPEEWSNGSYTIRLYIYSRGKILYNYSTQVNFVVYSPTVVRYIEKIPLQMMIIVAILGILFGFFGAKIAFRHIGRRYLPRAVGLISGREYIAYDVWRKRFEDPAYISGEWSKVFFGFSILARRYWAKVEDMKKRKLLVLTINAEKWIFYPISKEAIYFLCVHSALNEFDLIEKLAKLKIYFVKKIEAHSLYGVLMDPEETLKDIDKKITELF